MSKIESITSADHPHSEILGALVLAAMEEPNVSDAALIATGLEYAGPGSERFKEDFENAVKLGRALRAGILRDAAVLQYAARIQRFAC